MVSSSEVRGLRMRTTWPLVFSRASPRSQKSV
uniref:Uncharacterized protein n=1 Tax=Anguilla anguilla TaxID=7936 RepID=A0A0E9Q1T2_ANGAN